MRRTSRFASLYDKSCLTPLLGGAGGGFGMGKECDVNRMLTPIFHNFDKVRNTNASTVADVRHFHQ